jgi:hypothetical protein
MLKLSCPSPLDPEAIDPIILHALNSSCCAQEQKFFKAILIGNRLPSGPYLVLAEDWKGTEGPLFTYLTFRTTYANAVDMTWDRYLAWPRSSIVPVSAKTTATDVQRACAETQRILHTDITPLNVNHERLRTVTRYVILYLTGHLPIFTVAKQPTLTTWIELDEKQGGGNTPC